MKRRGTRACKAQSGLFEGVILFPAPSAQQPIPRAGQTAAEAVFRDDVAADDGATAGAAELGDIFTGTGQLVFPHGEALVAPWAEEFRGFEVAELPVHGAQNLARTRRMSRNTSSGFWAASMLWTISGP